MLVTDVGDEIFWWQQQDFSDGIGHFIHQHPLFFNISVEHQHSKDVTNITVTDCRTVDILKFWHIGPVFWTTLHIILVFHLKHIAQYLRFSSGLKTRTKMPTASILPNYISKIAGHGLRCFLDSFFQIFLKNYSFKTIVKVLRTFNYFLIIIAIFAKSNI